MKLLSLKRAFVGALLLALLTALTNPSVHADDWPAWMPGSKNSKEFEAQLSMARLNERHGQHEAAMKIYSAVLTKLPNNQLAHHRLAVIAASGGDFATADEHFNAALKSGPRSAELMGDIGYCLFLQNRLDDSEEALRRTLSEYPTYQKAHNTLGMVLGLKGRYEEALNEFRQVVSEAEAHANLAFVMVQTGDFELANKHYHESLRLNNALRPAAEALVQLNGYKAGETPGKAAKPAAPAGKSPSPTASAKAATTTKAPARSTAKPSAASQAAFAPKQAKNQQTASQTKSQQAANNVAQELPATPITAPQKTSENSQTVAQQSNPLPEIAQPFAPQAPVVPTQAESVFTPAVGGLAQRDRLTPGLKAAPTAQDHMIAKLRQDAGSLPIAESASSDSNPSSPSNVATDVSTALQQDQLVAAQETTPSEAQVANASTVDAMVRAKVLNIPTPPIDQVAVSDDTEEMPAEVLITDTEIAAEETPAAPAASLVVPGTYALAAARAQADRLSEMNANEPAVEPARVPESNMQPIPLPPATEYPTSSQADSIPVSVSAKVGTASPASFVISQEEISLQSASDVASEQSNGAAPKLLEPYEKLLAVNQLAPWQIALMSLGGACGLVLLGKAARVLGRKSASSKPAAKKVASSIGGEAPQDARDLQARDDEESYTYLKSQVRDVCAGLPSSRSRAARIRRA